MELALTDLVNDLFGDRPLLDVGVQRGKVPAHAIRCRQAQAGQQVVQQVDATEP